MDLSTKFMYGHYTEECNDGVKYNARVEIEPEWLLLVLGNVWRPTTYLHHAAEILIVLDSRPPPCHQSRSSSTTSLESQMLRHGPRRLGKLGE